MPASTGRRYADADARVRHILTRLEAARTAGLADADSGDLRFLIGRVAELTAALVRLEWTLLTEDDEQLPFCPACEGIKEPRYGVEAGHRPDCFLAAALGGGAADGAAGGGAP